MAAESTCEITWENFAEIHGSQFRHIGLPQHLWKELHAKLSPVIRKDANNAFERQKTGETSQRRWSLHAKKDLAKDSDVYIVEHVWTSDGAEGAKRKLAKSPDLLLRLQNMMNLREDENRDKDVFVDSQKVIEQVAGVTKEKAKEFLDLGHNDLISALMYAEGASPPKQVGNDDDEDKILDYEDFKEGFISSTDEQYRESISEEFLQKMYKKYLKDHEEEKTVQYGQATTSQYSWEETSEEGWVTVLISVPTSAKKASIINKLTAKHWTLGVKGSPPIIDGDFYAPVLPDECIWTFDGPGVLQMTLQKRGSDEGMWPVCIKGEKQFTSNQIFQQAKFKEREKAYNLGTALSAMWYYNQTYQKVTVVGGPQAHCWYMMDETGSALSHSSTPNVKCAPFAYAVNGMTCSLIWPAQDIKKGDVCTRDFCPLLVHMETQKHKEARLLACSPQMPLDFPRSFLEDYAEACANLKQSLPQVHLAPLASDIVREVESSEVKLSLKFYVSENCPSVEAVVKTLGCTSLDAPDDAEALWVESVVGDVLPQQKVNRLSGEQFLLRRDILFGMMQKKIGQVSWIPRTFSLRSQLPALCVDHYTNSLKSVWIVRSANPQDFKCKPVFTRDLRRMIRLGETGPLVASHYCVTAAVFHRRPFCLQYTVMVPSLKPLVLHIHNTPRIRQTAEMLKPLKELDEYEPTLLSVDDGKPQDHALFEDFQAQLKKFYLLRLNKSWDHVEKKIFQHIGELFHLLSSSLSPLSQSSSPLSAVYGVDVLLQENLEPLIIGVNALPSFANDQVAKEVICLTYGDDKEASAANVTQVTFGS
ncbi:predicted protein [Nematostella vectensis]|uniref:CS domain-containing protein n=1 Tax=Nematostella vectensis TaxID=45351 RepID=A7SHP9_NEMVE|nr:uncharacterized protein LOC5508200 [Nematostella vectensis]EDO36773.1 predicted protein [Nematostella vectensis]|eukprot:XP_001628836.1 predicted protein [Nematostella vectensis]